MDDVGKTLDERAQTHGDYINTARIAQDVKYIMRNGENWNHLRGDMRETLDLIASKCARILSGDPDEPDHWKDIEGYARLVRKRLENEQKKNVAS